MKALVCEMCGSNDMIKQDGLYVCQCCRTKYTVEEARKMMIEIDEIIDVSGSTVKIDQSDSIQNFLEIGESAMKAGNGQQAEVYANKALEVSPNNSRAWFLKMRSYEHTATFGDTKIADVLAAGINVIKYSDDREKAEADTYNYQMQRAVDLLTFITAKMEDTAEIRSRYCTLAQNPYINASQGAYVSDLKTILKYEEVVNSAVFLAESVPVDALGKYEDLPALSKAFAATFERYQLAYLYRFRAYISDVQWIDNNDKLIHKTTDPIKKALYERAKQAAANYYSANEKKIRKQKEDLEKKVQQLTSQLDATPEYHQQLEKEKNKEDLILKQLGAFTQKKKNLIGEQITAIDEELRTIKSITNPITTSLNSAKAELQNLSELYGI